MAVDMVAVTAVVFRMAVATAEAWAMVEDSVVAWEEWGWGAMVATEECGAEN
jgi:hypothetical protein